MHARDCGAGRAPQQPTRSKPCNCCVAHADDPRGWLAVRRARARPPGTLALLAVLLLGTVTWGSAVPLPTITHIAGDSADPVQRFSVTFTEPVAGLRASDFTIDVGRASVAHVDVVGSGTAYTLSVTLHVGGVRGCPSGYTAGPSYLGWCGRSVAAAGRDDANDACAPYTLASVLSPKHMSAAGVTASARTASGYWYVQ